MMTASACFLRSAISSRSADGDGSIRIVLPGLIDPVGEVGARAREADPFPGGHAAIAAIERIGEVAFVGILQQLREERRGRRTGKLNLIFLQR